MLNDGILLCLSETTLIELHLKPEDEETWVWLDPETQEHLITLVKHDDTWLFQKNEATKLYEQPLIWNHSYPMFYHGKKCLLYAQRQDQKNRTYHMYTLPKSGTVTIGRKKGDITFLNEHISVKHACMFYEEGWWIEDLASTNGVYVNHKRIQCERLKLGDVIYLMGLQIIMGNGWIAINSDDLRIEVKARLPPYQPLAMKPTKPLTPLKITWVAKPYEPYSISEYTCKEPPPKTKRERIPLIYTLGPSLTMGLASLGSSMFMVQSVLANGQPLSSAAPSIIMAGSMLIGTLVWPLLSHRYEKRKEEEIEQKRIACYSAYLSSQQQILQEELRVLSNSLWMLYIKNPTSALQEHRFWRYTCSASDYKVCLGLGDLSIPHPYQAVSSPLQIKEDMLEDQKEAFLTTPCKVMQVPILTDITQLYKVAIQGELKDQIAYATYLILQHTLLYVPHCAFLVLAWPEHMNLDLPHFLPHQFDEEGYRFLCRDRTSLDAIALHLRKAMKPALLLSFSSSFTAYFERMLEDLPIALFAFHSTSEADDVLQVKDETIYSSTSNKTMHFQLYEEEAFVMRELCNIQYRSHTQSFPKLLSFLHLYQVRNVSQLQLWKRWQSTESEHSLQANLGVMVDGEVMKLDLHEHAHGPHGIVAGMTGSGKSELLITLILSLAVSYHPHDCAFILIDYKGGGMAKALERLPHCAGVITNLDGSMIQRSLNSLHAELMKRQRIFAETMKKMNASSMNIDVYLKLYHEGLVSEALPHLVIVADEFAELKQQEPQFMEQLIRIARIGRSLGVHLILATQKPSGVVDDQIWSNARFHICLKVADKADSMDMLKREEGAQIKAIGRYYLQVGYDELFIEGQSAYAKCLYDPNGLDTSHIYIHEIADDGSVLRKWQRPQQMETQMSELQVLIDEMCRLRKKHDITPVRLWLDALPEALMASDDTKGCIAMVDDPIRQRQYPLYFHDQYANTLIFAQELSSSQQMMKSMLCAFLETMKEKTNVIVIDADQGSFAQACNVYASLTLEDEEDIRFIMKHMRKERKRLRDHHDQAWLIFVHNVAALIDAYEDAQAWLLDLAKDHGRSGITLIMSATSIGELRTRLFQQFENVFVFHLHDDQEAHLLIPGDWSLPKYPLRARWRYEEASYELQVIQYEHTLITQNPLSQRMPILPECLSWRDVKKAFSIGEMPIGMSLETREAVTISCRGNWIVTGREGRSFYEVVKQVSKITHQQIAFLNGLDEEQSDAPMTIRYVPMEEILHSVHHPLLRLCKQEGCLMWCGTGLEEMKYQWSLSNDLQICQKQDLAWIKEEVMIIRRIEKV